MKGVDNKGVIDRVGERVGERVKVIHRWNSGGLAGYRSRLQPLPLAYTKLTG